MPMNSLPLLHNAVIKLEQQHEEFMGRKSTYSDTSSAQNSGWHQRSSTTTTTTTMSPTKTNPGYGPMEVDTDTIICYKCFEEGHMCNQCPNGQKLFQRVKYIKKSKKVAASSKGKEKEFVQGSSKDSRQGEVGLSKISDLKNLVN